jgi:hypothetical protein
MLCEHSASTSNRFPEGGYAAKTEMVSERETTMLIGLFQPVGCIGTERRMVSLGLLPCTRHPRLRFGNIDNACL